MQATLAILISNISQLIENVHEKTHQNQCYRPLHYRCVVPRLHSIHITHAIGLAMMHSAVNGNLAVAGKLNHV